MSRVADRRLWWIVGLAGLALITRLGALPREIVSWDESTFMLMAQDVLRGHLPYVALFDNKPPGMFFALAAVMKLFGAHLWTVRLFGATCVFAIGVLGFALARRFAAVAPCGLAALALVAAMSNSFGLYASTELPAIAFLLAALWLLVAQGTGLWAAFGAGLCAMMAVLFRTNLMLPALMMAGLYAAGMLLPRLRINRLALLPFLAGFALPLLVLIRVYTVAGKGELLWLAAVRVPLSYAENQHSLIENIGEFFLRLSAGTFTSPGAFGIFLVLSLWGMVRLLRGPAIATCITLLRAPFAPATVAAPCGYACRDLALIGMIFVATFYSAVGAGEFFAHYFLLLLPFGTPALAYFLQTPSYSVRAPKVLFAVLAAVLALGFSLPGAAQAVFTPGKMIARYGALAAANAIAADRRGGDRVWAVDDNLVYFYLNDVPPSPLAVHPSNITRGAVARPLAEAGYVSADEFSRLLAMRPRYIVTEKKNPVPFYMRGEERARFATMLQHTYALWRQYGSVQVYRLRADGT